MKTIYLIRHAKSDWNHIGLTDFDRPLNARGKKDAPMMGQKLKELHVEPDIIISSPAARAKNTIQVIGNQLNYSPDNIVYDNSIYHSSVENLIEVLNVIDNAQSTVILVGHNPGITFLSNYLTNDYLDNIVTCGIVKIEIDINDWNHIVEGIGRKIFYIYPKLYV